jgi:hypothetical protein
MPKMENAFCFSGSAEGGERSDFKTHPCDSLCHDRASHSVLFRARKFAERLAPLKRITVLREDRIRHPTPECNGVERGVFG